MKRFDLFRDKAEAASRMDVHPHLTSTMEEEVQCIIEGNLRIGAGMRVTRRRDITTNQRSKAVEILTPFSFCAHYMKSHSLDSPLKFVRKVAGTSGRMKAADEKDARHIEFTVRGKEVQKWRSVSRGCKN